MLPSLNINPSSNEAQSNAVHAFNDKNDIEESFTTNLIGSEVEAGDIKSKCSSLEEDDTTKTADDTEESTTSKQRDGQFMQMKCTRRH